MQNRKYVDAFEFSVLLLSSRGSGRRPLRLRLRGPRPCMSDLPEAANPSANGVRDGRHSVAWAADRP
jgi:hypothetical protein